MQLWTIVVMHYRSRWLPFTILVQYIQSSQYSTVQYSSCSIVHAVLASVRAHTHAHAQALEKSTVKANKLSGYFTMNSDASVVLSLVLYTFCLVKNPLLFLLSIESSSGGEEGGGYKQMTP